ncbi:hypothetical protein [Paludibacter propionicigenes]|nr:hypothetical protein [Paludibacter propionicigenes]
MQEPVVSAIRLKGRNNENYLNKTNFAVVSAIRLKGKNNLF